MNNGLWLDSTVIWFFNTYRKLLSSKVKSLLYLMVADIVIFCQLWAECVPYVPLETEDGVTQLQEQSSETMFWFPQLPSASRSQYQESDPTVCPHSCLKGGTEERPQRPLGIQTRYGGSDGLGRNRRPKPAELPVYQKPL